MPHTPAYYASEVDSTRDGEGQSFPNKITNPSRPKGQLLIEGEYHILLLPTTYAKQNEAPDSTLSLRASEISDTEESSEGTIKREPLLASSIPDLANGANFMVRGNGDRPLIPYKKDHFTGVIRPRRMMDDLLDKVKRENPAKFAEYARRHEKACSQARDSGRTGSESGTRDSIDEGELADDEMESDGSTAK